MANSVVPDQTAPIGAVCSGSTLFASILKFVGNVRQLFAADDFSRRHFSDALLLGALRVKYTFTSFCIKNTLKAIFSQNYEVLVCIYLSDSI